MPANFFVGFIGQIEPVGQEIHAQHGLQFARPTARSCLGVMRLDLGAKLGPRHQCFHA